MPHAPSADHGAHGSKATSKGVIVSEVELMAEESRSSRGSVTYVRGSTGDDDDDDDDNGGTPPRDDDNGGSPSGGGKEKKKRRKYKALSFHHKDMEKHGLTLSDLVSISNKEQDVVW